MSGKRDLKGDRVVITEKDSYGRIKANGPFLSEVTFDFEELKVNGSAKIEEDASGADIKINGKCTVEARLTVERLKINGTFNGTELEIFDYGKINGKTSAERIVGPGDLKINGKCFCDSITNIGSLKINGGGEVEHIEAKEIVINIGSDSSFGKIKAEGHIYIGHGEEHHLGQRFFRKLISEHKGIAEIEEIQTRGIVELDHCKVEKVYAKELFIGEECEIGEFIEIELDIEDLG